MMDLARTLMQASDARSALLCTVQNAAGRVFSHPEVRMTSPAPVPGDGCGVGYLAIGDVAPIQCIVHHSHPEFASDMSAAAADGRRYWQPGTSPITIRFTDERVASIIERGNRMVPEVINAGIRPRDIQLLVTNQPNPIFVRNWREALELPKEVHHDTFDVYGNLFGAGIPINIDDALANGKLASGGVLALGGFSHAGDYTAAAIVRWPAK
jgi:3-oxoacyl-[acyl-carrier-protein] synthase III